MLHKRAKIIEYNSVTDITKFHLNQLWQKLFNIKRFGKRDEKHEESTIKTCNPWLELFIIKWFKYVTFVKMEPLPWVKYNVLISKIDAIFQHFVQMSMLENYQSSRILQFSIAYSLSLDIPISTIEHTKNI